MKLLSLCSSKPMVEKRGLILFYCTLKHLLFYCLSSSVLTICFDVEFGLFCTFHMIFRSRFGGSLYLLHPTCAKHGSARRTHSSIMACTLCKENRSCCSRQPFSMRSSLVVPQLLFFKKQLFKTMMRVFAV